MYLTSHANHFLTGITEDLPFIVGAWRLKEDDLCHQLGEWVGMSPSLAPALLLFTNLWHSISYLGDVQVPRGAANPNPPRYQVVIEEVEQIKERAR